MDLIRKQWYIKWVVEVMAPPPKKIVIASIPCSVSLPLVSSFGLEEETDMLPL